MAWKGRPAGDRDGCRGWSSGKRSPGLFTGLVFATDPTAGSLKHRDKALAAKTSAARQAWAEIARAFRDRGRRPGPPVGGLSWERVKTPRLAGSPDNGRAERSGFVETVFATHIPDGCPALRVPFISSGRNGRENALTCPHLTASRSSAP